MRALATALLVLVTAPAGAADFVKLSGPVQLTAGTSGQAVYRATWTAGLTVDGQAVIAGGLHVPGPSHTHDLLAEPVTGIYDPDPARLELSGPACVADWCGGRGAGSGPVSLTGGVLSFGPAAGLPGSPSTVDGWAVSGSEWQIASAARFTAGDANLSGGFDSSDLVAVMAAGRYESGRRAIWREGDWSGDGLFDTSDMIAAMMTGRYQADTGAAAVPEPAAGALILAGLTGLIIMGRRRRG